MSDVTLIGLGKMGTALAEALLKTGRRTTVWNRNPARCGPVAAKGAEVAASAAAAVQASGVVVLSLSDYHAAESVLRGDDVLPSLRGRTIIQLSSGTPREAREAAAWIEPAGVAYLDGAILGYPAHVEAGAANILVSGPKDAFEPNRDLLGAFGAVRYLGENFGAASALDCAALAHSMMMIVGLVHGIAVCEVRRTWDLSALVGVVNAVLPLLGDVNRAIAEASAAGNFANPQASLDTWAAVADHLAQISTDNRLSQAVPAMLLDLFDQARRQGHGASDISSIVEVIRAPEPADG